MGTRINVAKADPKRRMVFGFFNINKIGEDLVEDLQGDLIETEELESAVYNFVLDARVMGERHIRKNVGRLVESFMITAEKLNSISECLTAQGIPNSLDAGCEGWFAGFKVDDEAVWEEIEKGNYPAFSIGGSGKRVPLEEGA